MSQAAAWRDVALELPAGARVAWRPNPGRDGKPNPQEVALGTTVDELFYGGAKGGAKTDTLLVKPLYWIHRSLFAAAFVRQTYRELGRVLDRASQIYGNLPTATRPQWNGEKHRYVFPSGAIVVFGYTDRSLEWTQGGNWATVLYDEMANDPNEANIETLIAEIRCPDPTISRQLVGSGNPGFAGHPWVKRRYIVPCGKQGGIAYTKAKLPNGEVIARSKQFVPSRVTDNPTYANDKDYLASLAGLPPRMKACLLDGDWDAATGAAFDEIDLERHLVKPFHVPAHWPYGAGFDWGFTHNCVFIYCRWSDDGRCYVIDTIKRRLMRDWDLAGAFEELVPMGARVNVQAGTDVKAEIEARERQKSTQETFAERGIHLVLGNTARVFGYMNVLTYLSWRATDYMPERQPMVQFFDTPGNRWLLEQLESLVNDPDDPRDVLKVDANGETGEGGDDGYDALRVMLAPKPMVAVSTSDIVPVSAFSPEMLRAAAEAAKRVAPAARQDRWRPKPY